MKAKASKIKTTQSNKSVGTQTNPSLLSSLPIKPFDQASDCKKPVILEDKYCQVDEEDFVKKTVNIISSEDTILKRRIEEIEEKIVFIDQNTPKTKSARLIPTTSKMSEKETQNESLEDKETLKRIQMDNVLTKEGVICKGAMLFTENEMDEFAKYVLPCEASRCFVKLADKDLETMKFCMEESLSVLLKEEEKYLNQIERIRNFRLTKIQIVDYLLTQRLMTIEKISQIKKLYPLI